MEDSSWWEAVLVAEGLAQTDVRLLEGIFDENGSADARVGYTGALEEVFKACKRWKQVLKRRDLDARKKSTVLEVESVLTEVGDKGGKRIALGLKMVDDMESLLLHRSLDLDLLVCVRTLDDLLETLVEDETFERSTLQPLHLDLSYALLVQGAIERKRSNQYSSFRGFDVKELEGMTSIFKQTRLEMEDILLHHEDYEAEKISEALQSLAATNTCIGISNDKEIPFSDLHFQKIIGSGNFGRVLEATIDGQGVAVKVLKTSFTNNLTAASLNEITGELARWSSLQHKNIVALHGTSFDNHEHRMCFVMELCQASLENVVFEKLPQDEKLDTKTVCRLSGGIASGLAYLHEHGIVHSDIKPGNVLLSSADLNEAEVKLCDFGLSVTKQEAATAINQDWGGTPGYMAPEVLVLPPKITPRSDIFSLGIVMWELIEKKRAWENLEVPAIISAVRKGARPEFSADRLYPTFLYSLVEAAWEQNFSDRPTAAVIQRTLWLKSKDSSRTMLTGGSSDKHLQPVLETTGGDMQDANGVWVEMPKERGQNNVVGENQNHQFDHNDHEHYPSPSFHHDQYPADHQYPPEQYQQYPPEQYQQYPPDQYQQYPPDQHFQHQYPLEGNFPQQYPPGQYHQYPNDQQGHYQENNYPTDDLRSEEVNMYPYGKILPTNLKDEQRRQKILLIGFFVFLLVIAGILVGVFLATKA